MGTLSGNGVNKAIIDYGRLVGGLALVIAWWRWSVQVWLSHQRESTWGRTSGGSIFTPYPGIPLCDQVDDFSLTRRDELSYWLPLPETIH